jgi:hypothetical protein
MLLCSEMTASGVRKNKVKKILLNGNNVAMVGPTVEAASLAVFVWTIGFVEARFHLSRNASSPLTTPFPRAMPSQLVPGAEDPGDD